MKTFLGDGTIFWGGRHENSSVFGKQPAVSRSILLERGSTRHTKTWRALGSEVVGRGTAFVTSRRNRGRP